jgi:peptidoglycan/xylan/chitin deacetylase (PgdA/CDA1 family)
VRSSALRAGIVLLYHRVGPAAGTVGRNLVPTLDSRLFEAQLVHLTERYRVVSSSDLQAASFRRRRWDRYPVAITFDDDLGSHAPVAMHLLRRAGLPATFFLSGASLDRPYRFWWERLQAAADQGLELASVLGPRLRPAGNGIQAWAKAIESASSEQRAYATDALAERLGPDPPDAGMRREDVASLAAAGFEIGFHTLRHDALPALDETSLELALHEGRAALEEASGRPLTAISYPHGKADARVGRAAKHAGFEQGFTGIARAVTPSSDPLLLPRVEVPHPTLDDFALQIVGVLERSTTG